MPDESSTTPQHDDDALRPYELEAYRFTVVFDLHAEGATSAQVRMGAIAQRLAELCTDPLGGKRLHEQLRGVVLNILCMNDATPVAGPLDPAELTRMQDAVTALQASGIDLGALMGQGGGDTPNGG